MKLIRKKTILTATVVLFLTALGVFLLLNLKPKADQNTAATTPITGLEDTPSFFTANCYQMKGASSNSQTQNAKGANGGHSDGIPPHNANDIVCSGTQLKESSIIPFDGRSKVLDLSTEKEIEANLVAKIENLKPNTKYRITFQTKIKDRTCFNTKNLAYPPWINNSYADGPHPDLATKVTADYYNWCGRYDFLIKDGAYSGSPKSVLNPWTNLSYGMRYANQDWFDNSYDLTTLGSTTSTTSLDFAIKLYGFAGHLYLDNLQITEMPDGFVSDADMKVPVPNYSSMKIDPTSISKTAISTNAAKFTFDNDLIAAYHTSNLNTVLSKINFSPYDDNRDQQKVADNNINYLKDLLPVGDSKNGYQIYKNGYVQLSVGADSTITIKLLQDLNLNLSGITPAYHFYQNGLLFARDGGVAPEKYGNGIFFSPILPKGDLTSYYYAATTKPDSQWKGQTFNLEEKGYLLNSNREVYDPKTGKVIIKAGEIDHTTNVILNGLKHWTDASGANFSSGAWNISYTGRKGDAYILSVFPPKKFDATKIANERVDTPRGIIGSTGWLANNKQALYTMSKYISIWNVWTNDYTIPDTKFDPTTLGQSFAPTTDKHLFDLQYPADLTQNGNWTSATNHDYFKQLGVKTVVYTSPPFFLTNDTTEFINKIVKKITTNSQIDGIYADGYVSTDLLSNLNMVRQIRSTLGDGYYMQHQSGQSWFFNNRSSGVNPLSKDGALFSVPFLDAYADSIMTGENLKFGAGQDDVWLNNFTGKGVSNTNVSLLAEVRPGISPEVQSLKQLDNGGLVRLVVSWPNYFEAIAQANSLGSNTPYNAKPYYQKLNQMYLSVTSGNGTCDFNESYLSALADCTKQALGAILTKANNIYTVNTTGSVANWLVGSKPLFQLHYTFDDVIASDKSGHNLNANVGNTDNSFPTKTTIDGREVFSFGGNTRLGGYHGSRLTDATVTNPADKEAEKPYLDLTGKSFSIVSSFKLLPGASADTQVLYSQGNTDNATIEGSPENIANSNNMYFGIKVDSNGKNRLRFYDTKDGITLNGSAVIDNNWHSAAVTYNLTDKILTIYLDGTADGSLSNVSFSGFTDDDFNIGAQGQTQTKAKWFFKGYMDDLAVSLQALTSDQIKALSTPGFKKFSVPEGTTEPVSAIMTDGQDKYSEASFSVSPPLPPTPVAPPTLTPSPTKTVAPSSKPVPASTSTQPSKVATNYSNSQVVFDRASAVADGTSKINLKVTIKNQDGNIITTLKPTVKVDDGLNLDELILVDKTWQTSLTSNLAGNKKVTVSVGGQIIFDQEFMFDEMTATEIQAKNILASIKGPIITPVRNVLQFSGTAEPNVSLVIYIHSSETIVKKITTDSTGKWSITLDKPLSIGDHRIDVAYLDQDDNESDAKLLTNFSVKRSLSWQQISPEFRKTARNISDILKLPC